MSELKNYDTWKALGMQVVKGSKAVGRDSHTGDALFSKKQVIPVTEMDWDLQAELYGYMEEANL